MHIGEKKELFNCPFSTIRLVLLDLDGTVYCGSRLLPGVQGFLSTLRKNRITYRFVTNFAGRTSAAVAMRLQRMGLAVTADEVVTAGQATAWYLAAKYPGARVLVLGNAALVEVLTEVGCTVTTELPVDVVVVGYDPEFTYQKICLAQQAVAQGAALVCTNPDPVTPGENGLFPDAGTMLAAISTACEVPAVVCGKPDPELIWHVCKEMAVSPVETLVIGDRLETDIAAGVAAGCQTALVLTGVVKQALAVGESRLSPDLVVANLEELQVQLLLQ